MIKVKYKIEDNKDYIIIAKFLKSLLKIDSMGSIILAKTNEIEFYDNTYENSIKFFEFLKHDICCDCELFINIEYKKATGYAERWGNCF